MVDYSLRRDGQDERTTGAAVGTSVAGACLDTNQTEVPGLAPPSTVIARPWLVPGSLTHPFTAESAK